APATAPTSARPAAGNVADRSGLTRRRYVTEETVVPAIDPTLLVASACTALIPGTSSSAGSWTSPPPPTTASIHPATRPTAKRTRTMPSVTSTAVAVAEIGRAHV